MELRQNVLSYYLDHLSELPEDKQFHFATRTGAWLAAPQALDHLRAMRTTMMPGGASPAELYALLKGIVDHPLEATINAPALRAPYFAKYPTLRGVDLALFRVRHLQEVYGIKSQDVLLEVIGASSLR